MSRGHTSGGVLEGVAVKGRTGKKPRPIPELDHWLRRRVRMCYWKQWRGVHDRVRNLLALGTSKRAAIWTGMSPRATGTCPARWAPKPG